MQRLAVALCICALLVVGIPAFAQKQNPLVGTWEMVHRTVGGKEIVFPNPNGGPPGAKPAKPLFVFTPDGFCIWMGISTGRPIVNKPQGDQTKEDILSSRWGTWGNWGTYSVAGNTLKRRIVAAMDPRNEGKEFVSTFRFDGPDLIVIGDDTGSKSESRYRRVSQPLP